MIEILPLAVTMMAGPQIMSAIIFVTTKEPVRVSVAFVAGVLTAAAIGIAITFGFASLFDLGESSETGSSGNVLQYVLVGLLILAALKNYVGRETVEPPKWLGTLMDAGPLKALRFGLLLILLMPTDIIVMLTVGTNLAQNGASYVEAIPFILLTTFIAALPLLAFLIFHRRAVRTMPLIRDWMNANSWLVNIIVCGIFILLIAG
jgi:hypothetical protein